MYSHFRTCNIEALSHSTFTNARGIKWKCTSSPYHKEKSVLDFIKIRVAHTYKAPDIVTLNTSPVCPIIRAGSFSNAEPITYELGHKRLLHPPDKKFEKMCHSQTLEDLPKQLPVKIYHHPCQICLWKNIKNINKGKVRDTSNLGPAEQLHIDFTFFPAKSIRNFTALLSITCAATRHWWPYPTQSKSAPVKILNYFLSCLQHAGHHTHTIWVDEDGALANSAEFTNLLTEKYHINMKTTGGYTSWLNGKDEKTHDTIKNFISAALLDSNHKMDKWCCAAQAAATVYNATWHSAIEKSPTEAFTGKKKSIHDLRCFGCDIYPLDHTQKTKEEKQTPGKHLAGSFMGYTNHDLQIKWWDPTTNKIKLCVAARFDEYSSSFAQDGWSPGSDFLKGKEITNLPIVKLDTSTKPFLDSEIHTFDLTLPPKNMKIGLTLKFCSYFNLTYVEQCTNISTWYKSIPAAFRRNVFILSIENNDIIHDDYAIKLLHQHQQNNVPSVIKITLVKRSKYKALTTLAENRIIFDHNNLTTLYDKEHHEHPIPKINKLVTCPEKPDTPAHIGDVLKSRLASDWKSSMFENFDKMHDTGTFALMHIKDMPKTVKPVKSRVSFRVKHTDVANIYELYSRTCANGSRMVEGVDFSISYAPCASVQSIYLQMAIAADLNLTTLVLDISNAFQSAVIFTEEERTYMTLPAFYHEWFKNKWPNHPLSKAKLSELIIQCLKSIQGTKQAGRLWWDLLKSILINKLEMTEGNPDKGTFVWRKDKEIMLICVETDDLLISYSSFRLVQLLENELKKLFKYTKEEGTVLKFLNFRIIQSEHGISIDQTKHIIKEVLNPYWSNKNRDNIRKRTGPFPTDPQVEHEIMNATILEGKALKDLETRYHGSMYKWSGSGLHIAVQSRYDLAYAQMRISGMMSAPSETSFNLLHHMMEYLYHNPHLPIFYPRRQTKGNPLKTYQQTGQAEYNHNFKFNPISTHNDSDLGRILLDRRPVSSVLHLYNGVIFAWSVRKQRMSQISSANSETYCLHTGVFQLVNYRKQLTSYGLGISLPSPVYEDNQATCKRVLTQRISAEARDVDARICQLHQYKLTGVFTAVDTRSQAQLADINSKPSSGNALEENISYVIGKRFYPPPDSEHYKLLDLGLTSAQLFAKYECHI